MWFLTLRGENRGSLGSREKVLRGHVWWKVSRFSHSPSSSCAEFVPWSMFPAAVGLLAQSCSRMMVFVTVGKGAFTQPEAEYRDQTGVQAAVGNACAVNPMCPVGTDIDKEACARV